MADFTYTTTKEMDAALDYNAGLQGITSDVLWKNIVDADMGTLIRNDQDRIKQQLFDTYQNATPEDKASIDVIVSKPIIKSTPVEPSPVDIIQEPTKLAVK